MIDDLTVERVRRATTSKGVAVRDLLLTALADLDEGKLPADGCVLVFVARGEQVTKDIAYRANLTALEEAGLLMRSMLRSDIASDLDD